MGSELHINIDEALVKGIRPYEGNRRNAQFLTDARNVECSDIGLIGVETMTNPFGTLPVAYSYPYPQLFFGKSVTLLAYATAIYEVDTSGGVGSWTTSKLTIWDYSDDGTEKSVDAGTEPWHFIDLEDYWYLVCPTAIVFKTHKDGMFVGESDKVFGTTVLPINAGTYHRGRILIGGFTVDEVWSATWAELWTYWLTQVSVNYDYDVDVDAPNERYVMWSSIGGGDIPLSLLYADWVSTPGPIATTTGHSVAEPYMFQQLRRGEMGWIPMPFQGTVYGLLPLGRDIIAYCENGVARLTMHSDAPTPTYGLDVLIETGVADRGAFCGDENEHLFMDQQGEVYKITAGQGIRTLGYVDTFNTNIANQHMMSLMKKGLRRKYYITESATLQHTLTNQGLSRIMRLPGITSCAYTESTNIGVYYETADTTESLHTILVDTERIDFNYRGMKIVTRVEFGMQYDDSADITCYAYVLYKENANDLTFTTSSAFPLDLEGCANDIRIGSTEFKIRLYIATSDTTTGSPSDNFQLNYIKVWYQIPDRRWLRGI